MPIPKNKEELQIAIREEYERLLKELEDVPNDLAHSKTMEGHKKDTLMTPHNLVSYLVGWGKLVLKWYERDQKNLETDFPETGYKWNQLGDLAQKFYVDHQDVKWDGLIKSFNETTKKIENIIEESSNKQLYDDAWYDKYSLGRMIQLNTASPFKNARQRLRKWKKQQHNLL